MKTQTCSLKNWVKIFAVVSLLVAISACNNAKTVPNDISAKSENVVKPAVDINTAALTGNVEAIEQHIKLGTDLNSKEPYGGSTPLITAAVFGKINAVKALINAGVEINAVNNDGSTALHGAAFFCNPEIVNLLLVAGADKSIKNKMGSTALESVQAPFESVKNIYVMFDETMSSMGLVIDLEQIENTRPVIAELLQ